MASQEGLCFNRSSGSRLFHSVWILNRTVSWLSKSWVRASSFICQNRATISDFMILPMWRMWSTFGLTELWEWRLRSRNISSIMLITVFTQTTTMSATNWTKRLLSKEQLCTHVRFKLIWVNLSIRLFFLVPKAEREEAKRKLLPSLALLLLRLNLGLFLRHRLQNLSS